MNQHKFSRALRSAIDADNRRYIKILLKEAKNRGINLNYTYEGYTPLGYIVQQNKTQYYNLLLKHGSFVLFSNIGIS